MPNKSDVHLLVLEGKLSEMVVYDTQTAGAQPGTEVLDQAEHCSNLYGRIRPRKNKKGERGKK